MVQSNSNTANSQRQQNLQQQYKQNIVQFNSTTNNKLQTIKSIEKHTAKAAENLEKPKKSKKNMNKKTAVVNTGGNHGVPGRSKKAIKQNFNNKGKLAPSKDEKQGNEIKIEEKHEQEDESKRRRSSAAKWNLKEKAAMPYGSFDMTSNGNQTAIDDDEENMLQLGFTAPSMQQVRPAQTQQNWQPQNMTPLQQNGFLNATPQMMNPMMGQMPTIMPLGMHSGNHGFMNQGYQQPINPLQHQGHLGMPNRMNMPTHMPQTNTMYQPMNTLGNPNYHTNNMITSNHMMIREPHSPIIPALPLTTSAIPTSYSDNYTSSGNRNKQGTNKKNQSKSTGQLTSEGSVKHERYAGTSFGVSAPMLKSFPKPSFWFRYS
ncbi:hypothetical protein ACO0OL_001036 [Hanseniaspora opuntiae]